jgi:hypothetical protein
MTQCGNDLLRFETQEHFTRSSQRHTHRYHQGFSTFSVVSALFPQRPLCEPLFGPLTLYNPTPHGITSRLELMDLLLLGAGMGVVGGMLPNPLQLIALTQVAAGRWARVLFTLLVPPLLVDGAFLLVALFFFRFIPFGAAHYVAYFGGTVLIGFALHTLWELRRKSGEEVGKSQAYSLTAVAVATFAEVAAPGTWIYWLTVAGPILAEGRLHGYWHVVPFFAGGVTAYYGASIASTCLMAWGAGLHKAFKPRLVLVANLLLLLIGISYIVRAYLR